MRRPHYAWAVCLGSALSLFAIIGLGINIFSVYQPYIIEVNHFTNAQGSMITTVRSLFIVGAMLSVNQLCDKFGLRRVMTFGMGLMVLSCVCFGFAASFPAYCVAAALTGLAYGYGGMVPLSLVIGHWFRDRRGFALGVASAGSGVSTIFAPRLVTEIIETQGMKAAFLWEAAFILALTFLVWLLIRNSPKDMGMEPYHLGGAEALVPPPQAAPAGMTKLLSCTLLFAAFLTGAPGGPGFSHLTVLYTTSGYDSMTVAALISFLGIMICVGKIICGQVYDAAGGILGNWYTFGCFIVAFILCCMAPAGGLVLPYLAITLFGLGIPISNISFAAWAGDLYGGDKGYESAVRSFTVAFAIGMLLFGPVPGILADHFGSYVPAYVLFVGTLLISTAIVQYAYGKLNVGHRPKKS